MKYKHQSITYLFLFFVLVGPLHGEEVWGARFPAPSPDGTMISFSYYGDIWVVSAHGGRAERLTVSNGYESTSYWSPDGKWIAFVTDRWGSDDICIIPFCEFRAEFIQVYVRKINFPGTTISR